MNELAEIRAELAALRATNQELREQIEELSAVDAPVSRRRMLSQAAAIAVGAVAGGAVMSKPAFAAVTDTLWAGELNNIFNQTTMRYSNTVGHPAVGETLNDVDALLHIDNTASPRSSAIGLQVEGRRRSLVVNTAASGGTAIEANGTGVGSTGLFATGPNVAINAISPNIAVHAYGFSVGIQTLGARPFAFAGGHGAVGPPTDASFNGEFAQDLMNNIYYCVAGGTPGTYRKLAGPGTAGSLHLLAQPKRVFDSRPGEVPDGVASGGPKGVLTGGGPPIAIDCRANESGVPADAVGVMFNLTITGTLASGFLTTWGGGPQPMSSSINWSTAGIDIANGVTIVCDTNVMIHVAAGGAGSTHLIIDIGGYYR